MMQKIRCVLWIMLLAMASPQFAFAIVKPSTLPPPITKPRVVGQSIADYQRNVKPRLDQRMAVALARHNDTALDTKTAKTTPAEANPATPQQLLSIYGE